MKTQKQMRTKTKKADSTRLNAGGFDTSANKRTWPRQVKAGPETRFAARAVAQMAPATSDGR
jgi:hypothetical protein